MQLAMIGLGRMGASMARRLLAGGHDCVVYDTDADTVQALVEDGATGASSLAELVEKTAAPRCVWLMLPAAVVDSGVRELLPHLQRGDTVIDGGNSSHRDDIRRAAELAPAGIGYVDVGTSGGIFGRERGYCLMVGGEVDAVERLTPVLRTLAPGVGEVERTPGRSGDPTSAEEGWLHCGQAGAGHFVKMVHNGIEYGMMAAYAEGLNVLHHADAGSTAAAGDAETAPMSDPNAYRYRIDIAAVAEVWRRGSVVSSWLLDLTAAALQKDPKLAGYSGRVSDSGEGRWTVQAAVDCGVPTPVLATALFQRFASRGNADFGDQLLSAMRHAFGGHVEGKA